LTACRAFSRQSHQGEADLPAAIAQHARQLGIVRDYNQLHAILRARVEELDISRLTIDDAAGLTSGHSSKILAPKPIKAIGKISMGPILGALGVALVVIEDVEALARVRGKLVKREGKVPAQHWRQKRAAEMIPAEMPKPVKQSGRAMLRKRLRAIGRKGGLMSAAARMNKLTPEQRSQIASGAARARWAKESR
jgi:hypothetical protein